MESQIPQVSHTAEDNCTRRKVTLSRVTVLTTVVLVSAPSIQHFFLFFPELWYAPSIHRGIVFYFHFSHTRPVMCCDKICFLHLARGPEGRHAKESRWIYTKPDNIVEKKCEIYAFLTKSARVGVPSGRNWMEKKTPFSCVDSQRYRNTRFSRNFVSHILRMCVCETSRTYEPRDERNKRNFVPRSAHSSANEKSRSSKFFATNDLGWRQIFHSQPKFSILFSLSKKKKTVSLLYCKLKLSTNSDDKQHEIIGRSTRFRTTVMVW